MVRRRQEIASELHVLQQAVASAVHELSQPLNVVNLMADNALEDVAVLQAAGAADAEILGGLRRRLETIVEQAEKASDITRWIRAFAVATSTQASAFDVHFVIQRIIGIFANDLRVAGIELTGPSASSERIAYGNEALLSFGLTEVVLWLGGAPAGELPESGVPQETGLRRIDIRCGENDRDDSISLTITANGVVGLASNTSAIGSTLPAALPLLALVGQGQGCRAELSRNAGENVVIRLSMPRGHA